MGHCLMFLDPDIFENQSMVPMFLDVHIVWLAKSMAFTMSV